jgi:hypothetical protein
MVKNLAQTKANKRVYALFIITVFSFVSLIGAFWVFNPSDNSQESNAVSVSTAEEAVTIAMPLVEQYANENNRTITTVEATFSDSSHPHRLLGEIENDTIHRPHWEVEIEFKLLNDIDTGVQYWIHGYYVEVWADTGEIRHHNEQGHYSF